jgi:hypothetical protein
LGIVIRDQFDLLTDTENKSITSAKTNDIIEYKKKLNNDNKNIFMNEI